jgi:hypothetical protein
MTQDQELLLEYVREWTETLESARRRRDTAIRRAYLAGVRPKHLAVAADLTTARIHQIINSQGKG